MSNLQEVLFITNKHGKTTHALIPIETYHQLLALKDLVKQTAKLGENEIYTFSCQKVIAKGYPVGTRSKPQFIVQQGSQSVLLNVDSTPEHISNLREQLLSDETLKLDPQNNCFIFTKDMQFSSPSAAASIIAGNVRNGLDVWINRHGFSLKQSGYGKKLKK